jgi:hypothetical protein
MNDKIEVWCSYDNYGGTYTVSDQEGICCYTKVLMTRRQYEALRDAQTRFYNAQQFVMRAMGLKNRWMGGSETEPEVDDTLIPE